jgi:hypoxanthine-DNA glycosylase
MICQGFAPIEPAEMRVLILGSMPGVVSLQQQSYYAHPRNSFWPIMAQLCNQAWLEDFEKRYAQLSHCHVGLWDVLAGCQRAGSLDSAIKPDSCRVNNLVDLIKTHPECRAIGFNGAKAFQLFKKHIYSPPHPTQQTEFKAIQLIELPSTSPANARLNLAEKTNIWQDKLCNFL